MSTEESKEVSIPKKRELPSLSELTNDLELAQKNDQLNLLLSQEPPAKWLRKHPTATREIVNEHGQKQKVPTDYLPIDKVELLMTRIFQEWDVEVLTVGALFNSVQCTVRVHYKDPITGKMRFTDGVGAVPVQTEKGKSASQLEFIRSNAIQIGLPAAKTYAQKDACEALGRIFGKDLNRKDTIEFTMAYDVTPRTTEETLDATHEEVAGDKIPKDIVDTMTSFTTKTEVNVYYKGLDKEMQQLPEMMELVKKCHAEIDLKRLQAEQAKQAAEKEGK
ncbi:hypothetical protein [Sphingobacterium mizutaii]|uniref:hypothetical protein n=1 Tax=Sphingobacterium mizutaii TaxID=1010 RepID=UPI0028984EE5|nr:hypothetical protein [Sphingobacterium mizutaii]